MNTTHSNTGAAPSSNGFSTNGLHVGYPDIPGLYDPAISIETVEDASQVTPDIQENLVQQKAILVNLSLSQIGRTRQLREGTVELAHEDGEGLRRADTEQRLTKVTKTLFVCQELKAIEKIDTEIRAYIARKCLPSPVRKSVYLIPLVLVEQVDARLHGFAVERERLVADFVRVYPRRLVQVRRELRTLFDRHDYPHRAHVASHFGFCWQFLNMGVPDALGEISGALFERERAKSAQQWAQAQEEIQTLLRVRLKNMVEHLTERLQDRGNGKPKIFRNTMVSNINDFISDFNALNITNDAQLSAIVHEVRDLMSGIDPQELRESANVREVIARNAALIETQLSTLIVDKPSRRIRLDED